MRYWFWSICYFFITAGCIAQDISQVHLMSYNIRMDHSGDNQDNWHYRKTELAAYLNDKSADFIGLQEVLYHQLTFLDSMMVEYDYLGVGRDDGLQAGEFSPIFYNKERWQVLESNTFWLSSNPSRVSRGWDAACHRVCTYGLFTDEEGKQILVLNTHFDHVGDKSRRGSLRLIDDFLQSFADTKIILMGDLNFTPSSDIYKRIPETLTDAFTLSKKVVSAPTFNGFKPDEKAKRRIDYILLNQPEDFIDYQVEHPKTKANRQLSDHYPIKITIAI